MSPIPASVTLGIAIALCASLLGNAFVVNQYLDARDAATTAQDQRQQADAAAQECSRGVESLQAAAKTQTDAANAARVAAAAAAVAATRTAQQLLARMPTVPGNDCASAKAQIDDWLSNRRAK